MSKPLERRAGTKAVALLIGGPNDGVWTENIGATSIVFPLLPEGSTYRPESAEISRTGLTVYLRHEIYGLPVYIERGTTLRGAILRLLAHYKPEKHK